MASAFTEHVRNFRGDQDAPEEVLRDLGELLRQRMRRRGLLSAPPAFLGCGGPNWNQGDTWDELLTDCYLYAFLESGRLEALQNHLTDFPTIDGLIRRNVDQFLLERQRRNDPIGRAVYGNVEGAVGLARSAGLVTAEGLDGHRLTSQCIIRFGGAAPASAAMAPEMIRQAVATAPGWSDVLPHLVRTTEAGQEWVLGLLQSLRATGAGAVLAGDLIAALAAPARSDWAARHAVPSSETAFEGQDEAVRLVRTLRPDTSAEDREQWEWIKREVAREIETLDRQQRVRERLARIFAGVVAAVEASGPEPVRQADLVRGLDVPRATLSDDFAILREIVTRVRARE
jgi:hypothetical protein